MVQLSIVIPNYNRATMVGRAIDSALAQGRLEVEVIVIDDGSSDESRNIIEGFGNRVRAYFTDNRGVSAARNLGLSLCLGKYVVFLDSDDQLVPDSLYDVFYLAEKANKSIIYNALLQSGYSDLKAASNYNLNALKCGECVPPVARIGLSVWLCLFRKSDIDRSGVSFREDMSFGEDFDFNYRLTLSGIKFIYSDKYCYIVNDHEGNRLSRGAPLSRLLLLCEVLDECWRNYATAFQRPENKVFRVRFANIYLGLAIVAARRQHEAQAQTIFQRARQVMGTALLPNYPIRCLLYSVAGVRNVESAIVKYRRLRRRSS